MSASSVICLRPLNGDDSIPIVEEKITLGRGPFLKITDKRVSRNHAILEIVGDKAELTAIHTNPCFLKSGKDAETSILHKGQKQQLKKGLYFGLLPDGMFYEVVYNKSVANGDEDGASNDTEVTDEGDKAPTFAQTKDNEGDEDNSDEGRMEVDESGDADVKKPGHKDSTTKSRNLPKWLNDSADSPIAVKPQKSVSSSKQKTRKLKATKETHSSDDNIIEDDVYEEEIFTPKKRGRGRGKKVEGSDDNNSDSEFQPKKRAGSRTGPTKRGRKKKNHDDDDQPKRKRMSRKKSAKDESEEDTPTRTRPTRAAAQKRASYVDDIIEDEFSDEYVTPARRKGSDDSDFIAEASDDSDHAIPKMAIKRSRGRQSSTSKPPVKRTPRGRKKLAEVSDEEIEDDEPEAYKPRVSKKRAASMSQTTHSSDAEGDSPEKRPKCEFGLKCYRKNPAHFKEVCHPGDDSWEDSAPDELPDCQYGSNCYRRSNKAHCKQYNHPPPDKDTPVIDDDDSSNEKDEHDAGEASHDNSDLSDEEKNFAAVPTDVPTASPEEPSRNITKDIENTEGKAEADETKDESLESKDESIESKDESAGSKDESIVSKDESAESKDMADDSIEDTKETTTV